MPQRNKETGDDLALDIRRCEKSSCEKRKNHQKTMIVRGGFHRKTPRFWQTDHNCSSSGGCFPSYSSKVAGAIKELPLALIVGTHPALPSSRNAARLIFVFQSADHKIESDKSNKCVISNNCCERLEERLKRGPSLSQSPNEQAKLQSEGAIRRNGCTLAMVDEVLERKPVSS
ncbi:hypothetical protein D5086_030422 [Populus alba]|uniref:Uncharacterized protein n=1 Tax=Populus alba TaxID=43335 RepID=A0ACC4AP88_POPAL